MTTVIKDLIKKSEIQSETLNKIITHKDTSEQDKEKCEACDRFVKGFIIDLKKLLT